MNRENYVLASSLVVFLCVARLNASSASITLASTVEAQGSGPKVHVTIKNLSDQPLTLPVMGAFFDYDVSVKDSKGRPAKLTKEGRDIRYGPTDGKTVIVSSGSLTVLWRNQTLDEILDLQRFFELAANQRYRVVVRRKLVRSNEKIRSNRLTVIAHP